MHILCGQKPSCWAGIRRRRERHGRRRDAGRPAALEALEGRVVLATIAVASLADAGPGTLRAAIERANLHPAPDTIVFDPSLTGTIVLQNALPELASTLLLTGPGDSLLTVARSDDPATPAFRILTVQAGARVKISGLTLTNGLANELQDRRGGGILNAGTLIVSNSTLADNSAIGRVGSFSTGTAGAGSGGGIYNSGTLTVSNSTLADNSAIGGVGSPSNGGNGSGGGIYNSGTLTVSNSTLADNSAIGGLGFGFGGTGSGGGIYNSGTLTVSNSTLADNSASGGPSFGFGGTGSGGGIYNSGTLTVTNSTLADNSASGGRGSQGDGSNSGPGIGGGIVNTTTGTLGIQASILAVGQGGTLLNTEGSVTSLGHNLFSDVPSLPLNPTDLTNTDPLLAPLGDYGGPTRTRALLPGSPALDTGILVPGVITDQRGVPRPQGAAPDIGAFELERPPRITGLERFGVHAQPTRIVLAFSQSLDAARAEDSTNYRLSWAGRDRMFGTGDDRPISLARVNYDPATRTVSLRPRLPLPLRLTYQLTVVGTPPSGLTGNDGDYLDGAGSAVPGTDYTATFGRESLVNPGPSRQREAWWERMLEAFRRRDVLEPRREGPASQLTVPTPAPWAERGRT